MNKITAGMLAGLVLALVFVVYMFVRGRALVSFFRESGESMAGLTEGTLFYLILGGFVAVGLLFGALSGLVYGWIGSGRYFTGLAFGLAILFSILALVSKQPLVSDKIVWNFAVGIVLGVLVPLLAV